MKNILAIAVHPDDETLGCGGTLLRYKKSGSNIHWLICTAMNEELGYSKERILKREKEIEKVAHAYNFNSVHQLGLSTTKVDQYPFSFLVNEISNVLKQIQPDTVYFPFNNDVHSDHRIISNVVSSCTKSFRFPSVTRLLMTEILSETEFAPLINGHTFIPNVFIDITDFLDQKIEIMKLYSSEISSFPYPRSIKGIQTLASFRGLMAGYNSSESFMLVKERI